MSDVFCFFLVASCTVWLKLACHQCVLPHMPLYCMNWVKYLFSWLIYGFVAVGIRIVTRDYNGMLGTSLGVCAHMILCVLWVCGWAGECCRREAWIGSALILGAQCHTRCNATPTLPGSVFEQAHTPTPWNHCAIVWLVLSSFYRGYAN